MKIIKLLLIGLFIATISCSSDDSTSNPLPPEPVEPSIVGTWTMTSIETTINTTTTTSQGDSTTANSTGDGSNLNIVVTFTENPNNSTSTGTYSLTLTTDFGGGQTTTQTFDNLSFENLVGGWSINGNQLTILTPLDNTINATISSLTETTLIYNSVLEESFTDANNNDIVNIITQNLSYSR